MDMVRRQLDAARRDMRRLQRDFDDRFGPGMGGAGGFGGVDPFEQFDALRRQLQQQGFEQRGLDEGRPQVVPDGEPAERGDVAMRVVREDEDGRAELTREGGRTFFRLERDGEVIYDGEATTAEQRAAMPDEARRRLEAMAPAAGGQRRAL